MGMIGLYSSIRSPESLHFGISAVDSTVSSAQGFSVDVPRKLVAMRISFFPLVIVVVVAFVASFVAAESAVQGPHVDSTGNLKGTQITVKKGVDLSEEEERGAAVALARLRALFGKDPTKAVRLTDTKVREIKTYARSNSDKWYAMTYYLNYAFGITFVLFLAGGAYFLGWRFPGAGTSH
ncbi:hypothetical protein PRIC2_014373 [Phytophthora ramorum]